MTEAHRTEDERSQAARIADRLLDEPYADPDDDIRVVCRQFNRSQEEIKQLRESLEANIVVSKQRYEELERWKAALSRLRGIANTCLALKPTSGMMRSALEQIDGSAND